MSYDPIHDTYTTTKQPDPTTITSFENPNPTTINTIDNSLQNNDQHSKQHQKFESPNVFEASHNDTLSISNLVSSNQQQSTIITPKANKLSALIDSTLANDEENDDDEYNDDTDVNSTILGDDDDYASTPPPKNKDKKEKKSSSSSKKKKKNNIANAKLSLKKSDGEPFWRKDIQYDFLKELFDDPTPCFTNSFPHSNVSNCNNNPKISFGELYVRTLAESNKCSRVLKEKLIKDLELGKAVSMVCILVNVGRMNTTINFVPEMKSTLRTFHSIPSLQTGPEGGTTKQLQDTPRLKSILKAVCEGEENNLGFLDVMMKSPPIEKPNTNVIQLLFLLSNAVNEIPYMTEPNSHLLDLFVEEKFEPKSRARKLLWLLYTYLETSFHFEELSQNPFGGIEVPKLISIPDDQLESYDKDPDYEVVYADEMYKTRMQFLADEDQNEKDTNSKSKKREYDLEDNDELNSNLMKESETIESKKRKIEPRQLELQQQQFHLQQQKQQKQDQQHQQQKLVKQQHQQQYLVPNQNQQFHHQMLHQKLKRNNPNVPSPLSQNVVTYTDISNGDSKSSIKDATSDVALDKNPTKISRDELHKIVANFKTNHRIEDQVPVGTESVNHRCELVELSRPMVHEVRTSSKASTASFNKKTTILGNWLYRYFRYKKSIGNKLVGMEWEDIRYELVKGVEAYMYENFGKSLVWNDLHDDLEAQSIEEELQFDYFPLGDYDKANEKNFYILHITTFCNEWFLMKLQEKLESQVFNVKHITFDLENETVSI